MKTIIYEFARRMKYSSRKIFARNKEKFLKRRFKKLMGRELNLQNPTLFSDKIQWLKLYNHDPRYTMAADKFAVRNYVKEVCGEEYLVPLVAVLDKAKDLKKVDLPEKFVIKTTHSSGWNIICNDKSKFDLKKAVYKLSSWLKIDYSLNSSEWQYKNASRKIIIEHFLEGEDNLPPDDYQFWSFDGEVKLIMVDFNAYTTGRNRNFYDCDWNFVDLSLKYPNDPNHIHPKPKHLDKMIDAAKKLSKGFPVVRVDLYEIGDDIKFGEMTFCNGAGMQKFTPAEWEKQFGDWIKLPTSKRIEGK